MQHEVSEKIKKARTLCVEVKELAQRYNLPFFFVTDGASIYNNNGNAAIKNAREAQIRWEKDNGFDYKEDWEKDE